MKISELSTKDFLGKNGAATNSYVLINYAESPSASPVTTKATIEELGKSIVNQLQLYVKSASGPSTIQVENNNHYQGQLEKIGGNSGGNSGDAVSINVTADQEGNYSYEIPGYDDEDYFDPTTMSPSGAMLVFTTAESEPIQERPLLIWDAIHQKAVPYNLANPFYIEENSSLISRGQNVFVNADDSTPDKLYIMTSAGPSEISIGGGGGSSEPIIETMQTTVNAVPNQGGAQEAAIVFTPVDMSGYFNGLYACDENGDYDLLNLTTNLLYTSIDDQNVHYQPLWTDGQGNLYYYDQDHWSQVTP